MTRAPQAFRFFVDFSAEIPAFPETWTTAFRLSFLFSVWSWGLAKHVEELKPVRKRTIVNPHV